LSIFSFCIKVKRLGWAGHVLRLEDERIPEDVLNGKFHETRPVGKPRTRWKDVVRRDTAQVVGITGMKTEKNGDVV
jgi:hypothetical protein